MSHSACFGLCPAVLSNGQKLVGRPEATGRQHRRRHRGKRFELLCRIGAKVDFGALQAGVSEPQRDFPEHPESSEALYGAGMAQYVRTDAVASDRRRFASGGATCLVRMYSKPERVIAGRSVAQCTVQRLRGNRYEESTIYGGQR